MQDCIILKKTHKARHIKLSLFLSSHISKKNCFWIFLAKFSGNLKAKSLSYCQFVEVLRWWTHKNNTRTTVQSTDNFSKTFLFSPWRPQAKSRPSTAAEEQDLVGIIIKGFVGKSIATGIMMMMDMDMDLLEPWKLEEEEGQSPSSIIDDDKPSRSHSPQRRKQVHRVKDDEDEDFLSPPPEEDDIGKGQVPIFLASTSTSSSTNFLDNLGSLSSFVPEEEENDFGILKDTEEEVEEESVNLTLFEELEGLGEEEKDPLKEHRSSSSSSLVTDEHNYASSPSEEDLGLLQFQSILASLPQGQNQNEDLGRLLEEIGGSRTSLVMVGGEAMVPMEIVNSDDHHDHVDLVLSERSQDLEVEDEDEDESFMEAATAVVIGDEDERCKRAERILDALLLGDVMTAESYLPSSDEEEEEEEPEMADAPEAESEEEEESSSSDSSYHDDDEDEDEDEDYIPEGRGGGRTKAARKTKVTPTNGRGRKPSSALPLPPKYSRSTSLPKDKVLRKKEQNKSAAVRYRQKKKMEFAEVLDTEAELQAQKESLLQQRNDLRREIDMVKGLLRDVLYAKQLKKQPTSSLQKRMHEKPSPQPLLLKRNRRK